jgi:hypothetical protein
MHEAFIVRENHDHAVNNVISIQKREAYDMCAAGIVTDLDPRLNWRRCLTWIGLAASNDWITVKD